MGAVKLGSPPGADSRCVIGLRLRRGPHSRRYARAGGRPAGPPTAHPSEHSVCLSPASLRACSRSAAWFVAVRQTTRLLGLPDRPAVRGGTPCAVAPLHPRSRAAGQAGRACMIGRRPRRAVVPDECVRAAALARSRPWSGGPAPSRRPGRDGWPGCFRRSLRRPRRRQVRRGQRTRASRRRERNLRRPEVTWHSRRPGGQGKSLALPRAGWNPGG